jgi:hypothetical protein
MHNDFLQVFLQQYDRILITQGVGELVRAKLQINIDANNLAELPVDKSV